MKTRRLRLTEEKKPRSKVLSTIIALTIWAIIILIVYFVDPQTLGIIPTFLFLIFLGVFLTTTLIFKNKRQGIIVSSAVLLFMVLRFFGIGNLLNLLLIVGIVVAVEIYLHSK